MSKRTDKQILARINKNDITAWDDLYEKYSPVMLAAISIFTRDKILAEKILMDTWLVLREQNAVANTKLKLSVYLYIFSFRYTLLKFKAQGLTPCVKGLDTYPQIIQQLCKKYGVQETQGSELSTNKQVRLQKNTYCWLPVLGDQSICGPGKAKNRCCMLINEFTIAMVRVLTDHFCIITYPGYPAQPAWSVYPKNPASPGNRHRQV